MLFRSETISQTLNAAAAGHEDPTLVNLASQEYFGAVDAKALKLPVVTCHFKEEKAGELRVLGFFAKKARGRMARYAIDNRIDRAEGLRASTWTAIDSSPNSRRRPTGFSLAHSPEFIY